MTPQKKFSLSVDMACLNLGPWTPEPKADVRASLQELEDQVSRFLKLHEEHASKLDAEVVEIPICVTSNTVSDHGECDFNTSGGSADSKNIYNGSARQNGHSQVMSDKDVGVSCTSDGSTDSKNRHPDGAKKNYQKKTVGRNDEEVHGLQEVPGNVSRHIQLRATTVVVYLVENRSILYIHCQLPINTIYTAG